MLYKLGAAKVLEKELNRYNIDIAALQEIRWPGIGKVDQEKGYILHSGKEGDIHEEGVGFCLSRRAYGSLIEFSPISSRIAKIRLNAKWFKLTILCLHAHTEVTEDHDKDEWYDRVQSIIDQIPRHDVVVIMGDMNAKIGRETDAFHRAIGPHSLHHESNDNVIRLATLALQNDLIIGDTVFPHKEIHKGTWVSPDGCTVNQIDHIMIKKKFKSTLFDTRAYRGADFDSDHMLVIGKIKIKLKSKRSVAPRNDKLNIESLENMETRNAYVLNLQNRFEVLDQVGLGTGWEEIRSTVIEAATETLGMIRNARRNDWFDQECVTAAGRRRNVEESGWRIEET